MLGQDREVRGVATEWTSPIIAGCVVFNWDDDTDAECEKPYDAKMKHSSRLHAR